MPEDEKTKKVEATKNDKLVKFMNESEHFTYGCDGGCLAMFVNGIRFCVLNCDGDGVGTVYIPHGNHIEVPCPFDDELIAKFGWCRNDTDPPIKIEFSDCDILLDEDHIVHTITANAIAISRIPGTCDFVFRCTD